mmetsp:Transcript_10307/g.15070  ORF Transcript_10307/g.15070 Transcript_10307/m.15070 type:complete len:142 (-) Transcript_10307:59-484(-)
MAGHKYERNEKKLAQLRAAAKKGSRVGGARRKVKSNKGGSEHDQKLQQVLKKNKVQPLPGIEEVNFFMKDDTVVQFNKPQVQAAIQSNTFVISGKHARKNKNEILPNMIDSLPQGADLEKLKELIQAQAGGNIPNVDSFEN